MSECYRTLEELAFDNVSSSMQIAFRLLDCAYELFDQPDLVTLIERILHNQNSMAAVINACLVVLKARKNGERRLIAEAKESFILSSYRAVEQATRELGSLGSLATYSYSSAVKDLIVKLKPRVYLSVAHPAREGERLAEQLLSNDIEVLLFEDCAYSLIMREVDAVVVGADAIFNDSFVNKTGTLSLVMLAKKYSKPFYVIGCRCKYLDETSAGLYSIKEMPQEEISTLGCRVVNRYFERVDLALITKLFKG